MNDLLCVRLHADYKQFQFDLVDKFVERGECELMFCWKVCRQLRQTVQW